MWVILRLCTQMSDKFQQKYHIPSARLQNWDYRWNAAYFVTICTHDKEHFFGEIVDGKMALSHQGVVADVFWNEIKNHAVDITLGEYVVMPNHVHGIMILENNLVIETIATVETTPIVETTHALSSQPNQQKEKLPSRTIGQQRFQNQGKNSLSSIVGSYKSAVTKHANRMQLPFKWQTRFHDHIIRTADDYTRIAHYITNTPAKWQEDRYYCI